MKHDTQTDNCESYGYLGLWYSPRDTRQGDSQHKRTTDGCREFAKHRNIFRPNCGWHRYNIRWHVTFMSASATNGQHETKTCTRYSLLRHSYGRGPACVAWCRSIDTTVNAVRRRTNG